MTARGISDAETAETQVLGEILYQFLTHLELSEIDRLCERNAKLAEGLPVGITNESAGKSKKKPKKSTVYDSSDEEEKEPQVPIGYQYQDNFPSLPDADGRGKKMREAEERRKKVA